jgi:RNA recognition motif-containing protein
MELFIGNIPDDIDDYDLRKFFGINDPQTRFRIIDKSGQHGSRIRYGYAEIESDRLAHKALVKNNGREWRGEKISVRPFKHRTYSNDRRDLNWRHLEWQTDERRDTDRRGKGRLQHSTARDAVQMVAER